MSSGEHRLALPAGYELGKYRFREVLGSGGFGITYLADDRMLNRPVAVKELLPNDIATRIDGTTVAAKTKDEEESLTWARDRFVNEGRALAACDHPNVVHVYEMIEANGTAYMVTKYEEGRSLERWLKDLGRVPDEAELRGILLPLLSGLEKVHAAGFLHRDIKPDNIYITKSGRPVLLDFGSARQAVTNRSMALTSIVTSGYAPFEQYYEDGNQGPWSDIYAMGAVMFRAITGKKPPESTRRLKDDPCEKLSARYFGQYSAEFLKAVDKALAVNESRRPQSVTEWRQMLGDTTHEAETLVRREDRRKPVPKPGLMYELQKLMAQKPLLLPLGGAGIAVAAIVIWLATRPTPVISHDDHDTHDSSKPIAVVSPTAAPSVAPTAAPSASPVAVVTPAPMPGPGGDDNVTPQPSVVPSPTGAPTAIPLAQIDPGLVGTWQTGSSSRNRQKWEIHPDGTWVISGAANDTGMIKAADGHFQIYPNADGQWFESTYDLDGDTLVTHPTTGDVKWKRVVATGGNNNTTSNTTVKHSNPTARPRTNGNGEQVGRQILNHFMQGRGFP